MTTSDQLTLRRLKKDTPPDTSWSVVAITDPTDPSVVRMVSVSPSASVRPRLSMFKSQAIKNYTTLYSSPVGTWARGILTSGGAIPYTIHGPFNTRPEAIAAKAALAAAHRSTILKQSAYTRDPASQHQ